MNISEGRVENNSYVQLNQQKHDGSISTNKYAKLLNKASKSLNTSQSQVVGAAGFIVRSSRVDGN